MRSSFSRDGRDPRGILIFIAVLFVIQGVYAGLEILPRASNGTTLDVGLVAGLVLYAAMIAVFLFGLWRRAAWAWPLGVAVPVVGLVLAGIQVASGAPLDRHLLGMAIDGGLLWYLLKPNIRAIFGR